MNEIRPANPTVAQHDTDHRRKGEPGVDTSIPFYSDKTFLRRVSHDFQSPREGCEPRRGIDGIQVEESHGPESSSLRRTNKGTRIPSSIMGRRIGRESRPFLFNKCFSPVRSIDSEVKSNTKVALVCRMSPATGIQQDWIRVFRFATHEASLHSLFADHSAQDALTSFEAYPRSMTDNGQPSLFLLE